MSVINKNPVDIFKEPMFFGSDLGIARYDMQKHRIFEQLTEKQLSFFWRPEEVDLTTDKMQFAKLSKFEQNLFTKNLKYQILLDTLQGSAPAKTFGELVSDGSLDTWIQTWTFSETIHSRSYTHILRNVFADPSVIFEEVINDKAIMKRANSIAHYYDNLADAVIKYKTFKKSWEENPNELHEEWLKSQLVDSMKHLYLCLHSVNALEAIRFYVSFVCSFNFFENMKVMEGNMKIIKLIARDEQLHLKGTQYIIRQIQNGGEGLLFAEVAKSLEKEATNVFIEAVHQETDWADELFFDENGNVESVPGLNPDILKNYIYYITKTRMIGCGLKVSGFILEKASKTHPIPWVRSYLNSEAVQFAPQEVEISTYLISQIDNDLDEDALKRFKRYL